MRHFVIELYYREDTEDWKAVCLGEDVKHRIVGEPSQIHSFTFNNGVVHVHFYNAWVTRKTARLWVQAWFEGYFHLVSTSPHLNHQQTAKQPYDLRHRINW